MKGALAQVAYSIAAFPWTCPGALACRTVHIALHWALHAPLGDIVIHCGDFAISTSKGFNCNMPCLYVHRHCIWMQLSYMSVVRIPRLSLHPVSATFPANGCGKVLSPQDATGCKHSPAVGFIIRLNTLLRILPKCRANVPEQECVVRLPAQSLLHSEHARPAPLTSQRDLIVL